MMDVETICISESMTVTFQSEKFGAFIYYLHKISQTRLTAVENILSRKPVVDLIEKIGYCMHSV